MTKSASGFVTSPHRRASSVSVRAFLSLLSALMLLVSLGVSTVAHADEPIGCVDMATSMASYDRVNCDMVQVPADADRGYPHHHGVCHGHEIAAPADAGHVPFSSRAPGRLDGQRVARLIGASFGPALEPPQA